MQRLYMEGVAAIKKDKAVMCRIRQDTLSEQSKMLKSLCRALWFILALLELTFQWWERNNKNSHQPLTYQMEISAKEEQSRVRQGSAMGVTSGRWSGMSHREEHSSRDPKGVSPVDECREGIPGRGNGKRVQRP